ncbi:hypothetical protein WJR50_23575 [Catalinimonas sp. 4WD22]|uniref:hypothetical protein n=1 Tax=Catalinimonas locisalis TaxID=3133978 RepID=UPI003100FE12
MTTEYIIKRIYYKSRIIADFDLFAIKKLISGYKYFIFLIIITDLVYFLSKYLGIESAITVEITIKHIFIINTALAFFIYRIWKNYNNHKYNFPEPLKYLQDISEYSDEDLRKLVKQVNRRQIFMERLVGRMIEYQIIIPTFLIIIIVYKLYEVYSEPSVRFNFSFIFFMSAVLFSAIGFLLGARISPKSFKKDQNSIIYRVRNIIIDSLVFSNLNPGSNEIRKPR